MNEGSQAPPNRYMMITQRLIISTVIVTVLSAWHIDQSQAEPKPSSEVVFTESLELKTPSELWLEPGLRISLGYYEETYTGIETIKIDKEI